jgi:hypothetical protein
VLRFARDFSYILVQNATPGRFNMFSSQKLRVYKSTAMPFAKALPIKDL